MVLPEELMLPVSVPALVRLNAPPAEETLPVIVDAPRLFSVLVSVVPASPKAMSAVIEPGPLARLLIVLPPPTETVVPVIEPVLLIVVTPAEVRLPVIVPSLVTRNAPPAETISPVIVAGARPLKFSRMFVWLAPAAAKLMLPVIEPGALAAFETRLPLPTEILAPFKVPSLLIALEAPA
ncbi:MAG: hypothetical protein IPP45_02305 [Sphingomonadales bacterium]|nr:hypothetical protein [Sphingomonadales bacterium]